ncbi:unnamed protein product [Cyprideis torosa]|uniref:Uncharacterized protein n=1 Tax=Cyprideis torosa TaxID=163714 RepID=A0A7R8ZR66_9CRUS|nr:unnamed protein product [Cyprideis torosa]CAG0904466.1 unnamed protein product [Cyprideis torosa]
MARRGPGAKSKAILSSSESDSESGSAVGSDGEVAKQVPSKKKTVSQRRAKAVSSSSSGSGSSGSDGEGGGGPPPAKRRATAGAGRKGGAGGDLEEGEVSEGDSDESSDEAWLKQFDDGFDDDLMGDEADRQRLAQMTDKERETEIFKRIERRDALKARFEIEKKLRLSRKKSGEGDGGERRGSVEDAKVRSKDRKFKLEEKTKDSKGIAFSELKAKREEKVRKEKESAQKKEEEEKKEKERKQEEEKEKVKEKGPNDIFTTEDSDGEESDASARSRASSSSSKSSRSRSSSSSSSASSRRSSVDSEQKRKESQIGAKEQLTMMKLSRFKCERWCHLPFFKKLATGCFVRVGIGNNPQGEPVYRVCEVLDVLETAKTYRLGKTYTNLGLKLRHGNSTRVFRLEFISDQPFSDTEFNKWREAVMTSGLVLPTVLEAEGKKKELDEAMRYRLKDNDIEHIISKKEQFRKTPFNYAMKKTRLLKEKEIANLSGDSEKAAKLQEELNELEEQAEMLDKKRTATLNSIAYINERNRKRNVLESEKAIMEEARSQAGMKVDDPFTRRSTKPSMIMTVKNKMAADAAQAAADTPLDINMAAPKDTSKPPPPKEKRATSTTATVPIHDLFDAHNFEVDINLDVPISLPSPIIVAPQMGGNALKTGPKRSLNLDDYKKRRGLI